MRSFFLLSVFSLLPSITLTANLQQKDKKDVIEAMKLNSGYIVQCKKSLLDAADVSYKYIYSNNNEDWFYVFPSRNGNKDGSLSKLQTAGIIEIYSDEVIYAQSVPDDPMFNLQWGMKLIDLDKINPEYQRVWNRKAKMYICDSGPPADLDGKITHEDLASPPNNRFLVGNNYAMVFNISENNDTIFPAPINRNWDDIGHSTHVAGIAGAMTNNGIGVAGVDWVSEMTFEKILRDGAGWGFISWMMFSVINADIESREKQMDIVINISAGGIIPYRPLEKLIAYLDDSRKTLGYGVILVCSAGNHSSESLLFPAAYSHWGVINSSGYDNVISVGGVTIDSLGNIKRASYSAYGEGVDIWAPGGSASKILYINETYRVQWDPNSIWSLAPDSVDSRPFYPHWYNAEDYPYNYFRQAGTSMAAPHVTGAICRLLDNSGADYKFIEAGELKELLKNTGTVFTYRGLVEDKYGKKYEGGDELQGYVLNLKRLWEQNSKVATIVNSETENKSFEVGQNYPNPFNSGTSIEYFIHAENNVKLTIYNILGEIMYTDEMVSQKPGNHIINISASDLSTGTYLYNITAGNYSATKKMQLLK